MRGSHVRIWGAQHFAMQADPIALQAAIATARTACNGLPAHDALFKKINPELQRFEAAALQNTFAQIPRPKTKRWTELVCDAPPAKKKSRSAALNAMQALIASCAWPRGAATQAGSHKSFPARTHPHRLS